MAKYGKKIEVQEDILSYNIGLLGESGVGKSTIIKEFCETLVGEDGYLALNINKEDGHCAIQGIVSENVESWKKFISIIEDITENKETEYKDLKVVVVDTLDQLFELAEQEVVRLHNSTYRGQNDRVITTINAAFGGFQAGHDKAIEIVIDELWKLKRANVSFIIIGHTKRREIEDIITGQTYTTVTTNMPTKYFNAIKTKLHVLGVAYIDREIINQKTGKRNAFTKQEKTQGQIKSEVRKISFRDNNYTIDSKCRFPSIEPSIQFDVDSFINALKNAIKDAKNQKINISKSTESTKNELLDKIKSNFKSSNEVKKQKIRDILTSQQKELTNLDLEHLKEILVILNEE